MIFLLLIGGVFTFADEPDTRMYKCQKEKLKTLHYSESKFITLYDDCTILSWVPYHNADYTDDIVYRLVDWGIMKEGQNFVQKPKEE